MPTDIPISVKFSAPCTAAGAPQTITVSTEPLIGVAYHAVYADGTDVNSSPYYGGNSGGMTNGAGIYADTWVIGAGAPAGTVTVDVVAQSRKETGHTQATFVIRDAGRCE